VDYGGKLRTILEPNPKRRRREFQDEQDLEDEEDEDGDGEGDSVDDDTWAYSQVNLKGIRKRLIE